MKWSACACLLSILAVGAARAADPPAEEAQSWWREKFIDPEDLRPDASEFLESAYGFVPIGSIITDPTVGYGASLGLIFIRPQKAQRPNLSAIGGFATENGSWGAGLGDSSMWREGRLKTLVGAFDVAANLQFFGDGSGSRDVPLDYSINAWGALLEARTLIRKPYGWFGLRYVYADVGVGLIAADLLAAGIDPADRAHRLSGLTPIVSYDSRDNIFTPTNGDYAEAAVEWFNEVLGSDRNFGIASATGIRYRPVGAGVTFGVKAAMRASFDDVPFYLRPYVDLRGIQSLGLQAANVAELELELRWQPWSRYSLVAFAGGGSAWNSLDDESERSIATGGFGVRYLAARRLGLHLGVDVGFGPDDAILYFQLGNAWFRP